MIKLPGLIDPHVHLRDPGGTHKEDWDSGTAAALAGGITMVLAMPNTSPAITDAATLDLGLDSAKQKARCDYAQFLGAGPGNAYETSDLAPRAAGLKMYLDSTYGDLRLDEMTLWRPHFEKYPREFPVVVHAEGRSMAAAILFSALYDRGIHIAHISLKEEVELIKAAKERGVQITCEVSPHHLFLTRDDIPAISHGHLGRGEVRPRLATREDVDALWENLEVIDCFATDHAPHTLEEKDSKKPPPGFPGVETMLPLLITAVHEGKLTVNQIIEKLHDNPTRIFNLPKQPDSWVEVDDDEIYEIRASRMYSRCGWTPFEGWLVRGLVNRVVLRGQEVYKDGKVLAKPGYGKNVREKDAEQA